VPIYQSVCESKQNRIFLSSLKVLFIRNIMRIFPEINIFFSPLGPTVLLCSDPVFYLRSGCPATVIDTVSPQMQYIPVTHYV